MTPHFLLSPFILFATRHLEHQTLTFCDASVGSAEGESLRARRVHGVGLEAGEKSEEEAFNKTKSENKKLGLEEKIM